MDLNKAINIRHSARSFKIKKVPFELIIEAIDAAIKVPLAGNYNSLKFIIVTEQDAKSSLAKYADQNWISEADTIVVLCSDAKKLKEVYGERGSSYEKQQVGATIQNFLLRITDLGLASCWVGAYLDDGVKRVLHVPEEITIEAILPIGYEEKEAIGKRARKPLLQDVIYWEKWNVKKKPNLFTEPRTM